MNMVQCKQCQVPMKRLGGYQRGRGRGKFCSSKCQGTARRIPLVDRFWSKVKPQKGCWLWLGKKNALGYGILDPNIRAHRIAWELMRGPIPNGLCVLHCCDNPGCMNPDHLFLGSQLDNIDDMVSKGRQRPTLRNLKPMQQRGVRHGPHKGTKEIAGIRQYPKKIPVKK